MNILVRMPTLRGIPDTIFCRIFTFMWSLGVLSFTGARMDFEEPEGPKVAARQAPNPKELSSAEILLSWDPLQPRRAHYWVAVKELSLSYHVIYIANNLVLESW